jgi:DNA-binding Lrp family transcriptional regulator
MAEKLGIFESTLRHHLEKLKREGVIKREGADKGGKWVVVE